MQYSDMCFTKQLGRGFKFLLNLWASWDFQGCRPGTGRADPGGIQGLPTRGLPSETIAMFQLQDAVGDEVRGGTGREGRQRVSTVFVTVLFLAKTMVHCTSFAIDLRQVALQSPKD